MPSNPLPSQKFELVGLNEELRGKTFPLASGVAIGRSVNAEIFLPDPTISRLHCRIDVTPAGYFHLSCNKPSGVEINGVKVRSKQLELGDVLTLGRFKLRLEEKESAKRPLFRSDAAIVCMQDEPPPPSTRTMRGVVLAARLGIVGDADLLPETTKHLRGHVRTSAKLFRAHLHAGDPVYWRLWWDGAKVESDPLPCVRAAMTLQEIAYLLRQGADGPTLSIGLAAGGFQQGEESPTRHFPFGAAADRAMELALVCPAGEIHLDETLLGRPGWQTDAVGGRRGTHRCLGVETLDAGRREKHRLLRNISVSDESGRKFDAMVVRVTLDPRARRTVWTVLSKSPFAHGERIDCAEFDAGQANLRCRSGQPVGASAGFRSQFVGTIDPDAFHAWLRAASPIADAPILRRAA